MRSVRNVGNDSLNYVCYSLHGGHHWGRNFVKAKMRKTNNNFETFQNTVKLISTVCVMCEMMI